MIQAGDVIFVSGDSRLSKAIKFFQTSRGEIPSEVSHVAIAIDEHHIVEAISKGVVWRRMPDNYPYRIYRAKNLLPGQGSRIAEAACTHVGKKYGWGKLILHALDWCLGGVRFFRRMSFMDGYPICSWVVAAAYATEGLTFGADAREIDPDTMFDFIESNPHIYSRIL